MSADISSLQPPVPDHDAMKESNFKNLDFSEEEFHQMYRVVTFRMEGVPAGESPLKCYGVNCKVCDSPMYSTTSYPSWDTHQRLLKRHTSVHTPEEVERFNSHGEKTVEKGYSRVCWGCGELSCRSGMYTTVQMDCYLCSKVGSHWPEDFPTGLPSRHFSPCVP